MPHFAPLTKQGRNDKQYKSERISKQKHRIRIHAYAIEQQ
jgi:hypothetical protein